jgi:ATP-dependent DNA helicase RecQ
VSDRSLGAARAFLGQPGVPIPPRRLWPTGLATVGVPLSGKIPADEQAEPGRAVGRLTDLGWGNRLRATLAADREVPAELMDAVVAVLKDWSASWAARPVAVVGIDSVARPRLVHSLAERIAAIGRLPMLGAVGARAGEASAAGGGSGVSAAGGGSGAGGAGAGATVNSAFRVRDRHAVLALPDALAERLAGLTGPVLLVDDLVDSGWTMAIAARLLRRAGAPAVLPLALASTG